MAAISKENYLITYLVPKESSAMRSLMLKAADLTDQANDSNYPAFLLYRIAAVSVSVIATAVTVCNVPVYIFQGLFVFVQISLNQGVKNACPQALMCLCNAVKSLAAVVLAAPYMLGGVLLPFSYNCFNICRPSVACEKNSKELTPDQYEQLLQLVQGEESAGIAKQGERDVQLTIDKRKLDLAKRRQSDLEKYPPYLDELLGGEDELLIGGFFHLYDHIIAMSDLSSPDERDRAIQNLPFSELSHIVLEARKVIIQKVKFSIPINYGHLLFLLGGTGSGKSTTFCLLRKDEMKKIDGGHYESLNDDDHLIGHSSTCSQTFLPTILLLADRVVIDFPGFDDTRGQAICIGMELALKALIKKYRSKVLVVEAITNTGSRYGSVRRLGARLSRLFGDKTSCLLGLTKYSRTADVVELERIEQRQREALEKPTRQEIVLEHQIKLLSDVDTPVAKTQMASKAKELANLQQEREKKRLLPLEDTEQKRRCRESIARIEGDFLEKTGLKKFIRLDELEKLASYRECFKALSSLEDVSSEGSTDLDATDFYLIKNRMDQSLRPLLENGRFDRIEDFKESVLTSGLTRTLLAESNPEVLEFFSLPEISPELIREFDEKLVKDCCDKCLCGAITILGEKFVDRLSDGASEELIQQVQDKQRELREYILDILGSSYATDQEFEAKWQETKSVYRTDNLQLPQWIEAGVGVSAMLPCRIRAFTTAWMCQSLDADFTPDQTNQLFRVYLEQLNALHEVITWLYSLKTHSSGY